MCTKSYFLLLIGIGLCTAWMDDRPVLESQDGNLIISSAKDRNITLKIIGSGYINVNQINLLHVANAAHNATRLIERWKTGIVMDISDTLGRLREAVEGPMGLQRRVTALEPRGGGALQNQSMSGNTMTRIGIRRVNERIRRLENRVRALQVTLRENDCLSNPCQNGGTCQDLFASYQCQCTPNWEGPNCMLDVNECAKFLGTDLGCQNGATCLNSLGSYRCECQPGWFGLHCTQKTSICNSQNSDELCGHGVCVSRSSSPLGYTCICDQGWQGDATNPACTKDVDECAGKHPACSVNPPVACRNVPGSFFCESCPHGYTGNGYYCSDIDECLVDNGGCSVLPRVQCINTMGSRVCGPCPAGYRGDGVTCIYVGGCAINNGGCHPLATCVENPALTSAYVQCRCPIGYQGDGMGPNGCQPGNTVTISTGCFPNHCVHGTCVSGTGQSFTCRCNSGYTGLLCNLPVDPCTPNPCKNNGGCLVSNGAVTCDCPPTFTGNRCETPRQTCGGVSRNPVGRLQFPVDGNTYQHGLSCAWVLITNHSLVLNVTFTNFNLEQSPDCKFDFLQIHDGRNAGSHQIGRFCGNRMPNGGNIVSSHNALYFWFHSDSSISRDGFALHWNSIEPVCGGIMVEDYGTLTSPGSPGRYPPNRDCYWRIFVRSTKRIQFHFGLLMLEEHPTCENDYVEITGLNEERLGIFCNHTRPAPLVVPGSEAVVHFHSDGAGQDAGFHIHYSTIDGVPGCSGLYTANSGTIASPTQTSSYEPNMECEWKVQLPVGDKIRITWSKFDLESSMRCNFDYVEIYDGGDMESPLLGRFCGNEMPPNIKSISNMILVVFRTDASFEGEGFAFSYEVVCGGQFTEETGIIQSPMYPNAYRGSRTCFYEIAQPAERGIVLTIVDLDIEGRTVPECFFDSLEIFDGDNENSTKLATLCGDEEYIPSEPYLSSMNYMLLKFSTDSSIEGRGFKANFTTVERRCGALLKTPSGTIESPQENGMYADDEDCTWTIQAPPGYVIQLSWLTFSIEYHAHCRNDYVSVYENYTSPERELLGQFCGTTLPPILITQSNTMTIYFHTDNSLTSYGFSATYTYVDASKVCGAHYSKLTGVLRSPNYPEEYPNGKECVWVIEAQNKFKITLDIKHFSLENHSYCTFDYLEIRNGGYDNSPLIGKFCGNNIPQQIISQTNLMYIKFVSDISRRADGFEIWWSSATQGCGGILHAASGDIVSPHYPQPYAMNADCNWKIAVAAGNQIQLIIVDLDLENNLRCKFDYLEISEGIERRSNSQRYCGTPYPKVIQSKSNTMTVRFRSDYTNSGRGFHLKYETICHTKIRGFYGVLESPNFPDNYEHNTNCSWIIEAPKGNKINMTFSHFDLEGTGRDDSCQYDYLDIREGMGDQPNTQIGKYCNSESLPPKIHTTQNQLFLKFVTDAFIAFNGFRAEWIIDGCGAHLTRPSDFFTSPGYPYGYPANIECEWLIEVDYTSSIEITFHEVKAEKQLRCFFDKLQIYEGEDDQAPKLVETCHSDKPVVYTSPSNKLFVKFLSDSTISGRGFNASYKSVPIKCGGRFSTDSGIIHSANYPLNYPHQQNCEWLLQVDKNHVVNVTFLDFDIENSRNCSDDYVKIYDGPTRDSMELGTHCHNELPPTYLSTSNEMLVVMRSDSIISAKGFKALYQRACGARIIVKDQGFITPPTTRNSDIIRSSANCTWILVAEDPADHVTLAITHMDMSPIGASRGGEVCTYRYLQVLEGEGLDGPELGKWCNNGSPPPVTSTGSALTVHLFAQYDFHGLFTIMYSTLNSACGGNYTSEKGTITSPGYPNSYPLNAECIWILNNSPGNRISLNFISFDLEQSDNCDLDYLEIREESGIGKLMSVSCGTDVNGITSSKPLWVKFKSDGGGTGAGFVAEYKLNAGNDLEAPTGRITSPLFPHPYIKAGDFFWRITVNLGHIVQIEVTELNIERLHECNAFLKIYDGYNEEAPVLMDICGFTKPAPVTASSNVVYIQFHTDFTTQGNWFDLEWIQIARETGLENEKTELSNCTTEVDLIAENNATYAFQSPGWPHGYDNNLRCSWLFTSPPGTHLVLRIAAMNLEETSDCFADFLAVYSGNALTSTNDANRLEQLCYANATLGLVTAGNVMTVKFETDSYVNKTGFSAQVHRECGGKLGGPNGVIEVTERTTVRGYRAWYFTCEWVVEVRPGRTIEVDFVSMEIQNSDTTNCKDNYIMLKNGGEVSSPLLGSGKYCGSLHPMTLMTTGNKLFVKASGTNSHSVRFKLTYREKNINCGGEFVLSSAMKQWTINTPNYPNIPPPYAECWWKAMAPAGERISIHFIDRFDLTNTANCSLEYVEVRDGGTDHAKLLGRFCKDTPPSTMTTTGNMIYVHFYTEVAEPKNGFKADIISGEVCGGIIRGTSGRISSPNYPFFYPKNVTCHWWIVAPPDHSLKIEFSDFNLPGFRRCSNTDHVIVTEKLSLDSPYPDNLTTTTPYCGIVKPDPIETSSNEVLISFHSDNREYANYRGFSLNFVSSQEICGGELTALTGIIKSAGYPIPRAKSRYCDWKIRVPRGNNIVVEILDFDIGGLTGATRMGYSLSFYNDFRFKSRLKVLGPNSSTEEIQSSSNTMMIGHFSSPGHRGFKLRYTASAPAPCGGILNNESGTLSEPTALPFNQSSYYCEWTLQAPEHMTQNMNQTGITMSIKVTGVVGGIEDRKNTRFCFLPQYISVAEVGMICGNLTTPRYLRSPKSVNELTIVNGTYGMGMDFNLEYRWQPCGGVLSGPTHTIRAPKNITYPINCAWNVNYPDTGETIKLDFVKLNLGSCDTAYLSIRNGGASSPEIGKFCGNIVPYNITSTSNRLWIEYFANGPPNDFELSLEPASTGCGGALRGNSREISSPEFPKQYPNNAECTWEITAENGYHIELAFADRFSLETSVNCEKDYVQVHDWIKDTKSGGYWKELGKVCGRNAPTPFHSSTNRMKVTFRSNEAVQSDGFRALWSEKCGGVFEVSTETKVIQSPGYPNLYRPNLFCNYTLVAPGEDIIVEFTDFQLERRRFECTFDNLTITKHDVSRSFTEEDTWCGTDTPPVQRSVDHMEIIFKTDKYLQRTGFQLQYFTNRCGGILTSPGNIEPLTHGGEYFGRMNCTWIIRAPKEKNIVLRFEKFITEYSSQCYYDKVRVYNGEAIIPEKMLGLVCGNLTKNLPIFKSDANEMVVNFETDNSRHYEGFSAKVLFGNGPAVGCGGQINLTETTSQSFRTQRAAKYDGLEDCHWVVTASNAKNIRFTIHNMDIKNATNNTGSEKSDECTGDFLEILDGAGPYGESLGKFCGTKIPPVILSSSQYLWIRFFSDATVEGTGVTGTLEAVDAQCGELVRVVNETKAILTSPNYPNSYPPGTRCRWILRHPDTFADRIVIRFDDFSMADSAKCENEYLRITDKNNRKYIDEGLGENFIYSGTSDNSVSIDTGSRWPVSVYKYCGSALPHDFYTYSTDVELTFKSEAGGHKGFKLEYNTPVCNRNYTSEQGRIVHQGFTDCWVTITAPVNHTISLYFSDFRLYDREECTDTALQVRDGNFNGNLLATLCGVQSPSPIFSETNKLSLHSWSQLKAAYQAYDITYTTTDKGRGCGGRIFNYGGRFTSPLYPSVYRNNSQCTWDISVPRGFIVVLKFPVFDIGTKRNCETNYVKIFDVLDDGEPALRSTYCGGDDPAMLEAAGNRVYVTYATTVNNIGTGWIANFMGKPTAHYMKVTEGWY